jgi:hypothetical protein
MEYKRQCLYVKTIVPKTDKGQTEHSGETQVRICLGLLRRTLEQVLESSE